MRRLTIDLPDNVWGALASKAEDRGVRVQDLLAESVKRAAAVKAPRYRSRPFGDESLRQEVRSLWVLHYSVDEIARRMHRSRETVRATVTDLGLTKETI